MCAGGLFHAVVLLIGIHRENAREESARCEMFGGSATIISNVAPHFKTAGDLLRMIAFHPAPGWEIGWAAQHQIKLFFRAKHAALAKISLANFITIGESIPLR